MFCETVVLGAITVFAFAVFAATTFVIVEFNVAICAFAASIADCIVAVFGSAIGVNAGP